MPVEGELVLKLYYKRNSYTLTLNKNENIKEVSLSEENKGDSVYESYKYEQEINISATIKEQEGYKFAWSKWTTSNASLLSEQTNKDTKITMPAGNVTLTANANKTLLTYNVIYNLNEGTNNSQNPSTYTVEDTITLKEASKTGYTFAGWYEKADFSGTKTVGIANRTGDITLYAKWIKNEYKVIVHHYEEGTKTKIAEDEVIKGDLGASYQTKNLIPTLDEEGNITETDGREYLNPNKYTYVSVVGNESGVFTENDIEVTYYYRVNTFEITGEAKSGGSISNVDETVRYGEDSKNTITITPDAGNRVKEITINGEKLTSYTEDRKTKVVTLETIKNVTENKHIIVTFEPIPMVAKIIEAPEGYESLIGTEYEYLSGAIEKVKTGQETSFVIQIINDIDNETNIIIDRKVTIDLNSHTINANDEENATIVVRTGELKVIDSKAAGKISNSKGMAIKIEEGGALNLGVDDGSIRYNSPIIEGKTTGVYNLGTFNFYDGVIRGKTAIDGGVTDTPKLYDPKVEQSGEMQESVLAKVTDVEATIGKTRYATLEQAVDAANNIKGTSADEIEIDIVVDLAKNAKVVMDNTKNIVLDLNGYTLTNTVADYVIENQGKLKIIDSSKTEEAEGTGIIKSTTSNTLLNSGTGELTIKGGTITTSVASKNAIDIKETSKVIVEDGAIVSAMSNSSMGICIYDYAQAVINGGNISSNKYGVYNYKNGTTIINGGTITGNEYGIYNNLGQLLVTDGVITGRYAGIRNNSEVRITNGEISSLDNIGKNVIIENGMITGSITNTGTSIIINGGTIQKGITNKGAGTITITDGMINGGIYNSRSGKIEVIGGTITGDPYGIRNMSSGQIIVTGGKITGLYGIYNDYNGSITIGKKDGNVTDSVEIIAEKFIGLYNSTAGSLKYYDGIIRGKNAANYGAILGPIADIEDGYSLKVNIENGVEIAMLQKNNYIAQVGEEKFINLIDAVNACINEQNNQIIILDDFAITKSEQVSIGENKNIILNLNGKQITTYCETGMIRNNGSLTITDETESKTGKIISRGKEIIANAGDFKLENGIFECKTSGNSSSYINVIQNTGELSINGGTITSTNQYINAIGNEGKGIITINAGNIILTSSSTKGINTSSTGTIEINGGTISSTIGIDNNNTGTVKISGGVLTNNNIGVNNKNAGKIEICDNASINNSYTAINNSGTGTIILTGGSITKSSNGINNSANGKIEVSGGTITTSATAISNSGTAVVTGGTITGGAGSSYRGIYNSKTLTIGEKDGIVSTSQPKITGYCGVYNNGTFNFYDGIIEGKEGNSISGTINDIETDYDVTKYKNGESQDFEVAQGKEVAILKQNAIVMVKSTGEKYNSLKDALVNTQDTDTLTVLANVTIIESIPSLEINNGKSIALDLAGYTITVGNENTIINSGRLEITDSSDEKTGKILSSKGTVIKNNAEATLNITEGTISSEAIGTSNSYKTIIQNQGEFNTNGTINCTNDYVTVINNEGEGTVTITGGNITAKDSSNACTINNNSTNKVMITDGTITGNINNANLGTIEVKGGKVGYLYNNVAGAITISGGTTGRINNNSTGTVTITGGTTSNISNLGTLLIAEENVPVLITGQVLNSNNGNTTINGGTIKNNGGIGNSGTLTITKGTIICTDSRYLAISNSGTLTIGQKDGNLNEQIEIRHDGNTGVYNSGNLYYYGGTIKGKNADDNSAILGKINEIEENASLSVDIDGNLEVASLVTKENVAEVDGEQFTSLNEAINKSAEGTVKLLKNISIVESEKLEIASSKNITLDLNGKQITTYMESYNITNNGTLNITDSSGLDSGRIVSRGVINGIIDNIGTLTITNGVLKEYIDGNGSNNKNIIRNKGNVMLNGGIIDASKRYINGIYNIESGNVNITGGNIIVNGILDNSSGIIKVEGGQVSSINFTNNSKANLIVKNSADIDTISSYYAGNVTITIEGGNIGDIKVAGTTEISGGIINSIDNNGGGKLNITNGTIKATNGYGIINYGIATITGGSITSTIAQAINNFGTLTLGVNDINVSKTVPSIVGKTYGVKNTGTFNFYDGVIEGETEAISGTVTKTPTDYTVIYENSNKKATLGIDAVIDNVIKVNGVYYKTLQAAVTAINGMTSKTGTIVINGGIALESQVVIPEGTNITIELRGQTISYDKAEPAIVNNGTLTIVDYMDTSEADPSDVSMIKNTTGKAIKNNGALTLGINDGTQNANSPVISGGIEGNEPTIYDGKVE